MFQKLVAMAIWISGIVATACFGSLLGMALMPGTDAEILGMVGAIAAFVCLRLWLTER
ncbi:MAG: hypothetical protein WCY11_10390 [Novosphingobium sp.]